MKIGACDSHVCRVYAFQQAGRIILLEWSKYSVCNSELCGADALEKH